MSNSVLYGYNFLSPTGKETGAGSSNVMGGINGAYRVSRMPTDTMRDVSFRLSNQEKIITNSWFK